LGGLQELPRGTELSRRYAPMALPITENPYSSQVMVIHRLMGYQYYRLPVLRTILRHHLDRQGDHN